MIPLSKIFYTETDGVEVIKLHPFSTDMGGEVDKYDFMYCDPPLDKIKPEDIPYVPIEILNKIPRGYSSFNKVDLDRTYKRNPQRFAGCLEQMVRINIRSSTYKFDKHPDELYLCWTQFPEKIPYAPRTDVQIYVVFQRYPNDGCPYCGSDKYRIVYVDDEMSEIDFCNCLLCGRRWKPKE